MKNLMRISLLLTWLLAGQLTAQQYTALDTSYQSVGNKVCATCHGAYGQGNPVVGAPSLAGLEPWYLKRQLENFRLGVRGAHKEDTYGHQMVLMARSLQDEQSINDLLAYLNTL